jgi:hypothetical protein
MPILHANLIRTLALIYAVGDGAEQIGDEHLAAAMAMIEWMWGHVRVMLGTWGVDIYNLIEQRITTVLRKKGPMLRRDLWAITKNARRYNIEQWTKTLKSLKDAGVVEHDAAGVHWLTETVPQQ